MPLIASCCASCTSNSIAGTLDLAIQRTLIDVLFLWPMELQPCSNVVTPFRCYATNGGRKHFAHAIVKKINRYLAVYHSFLRRSAGFAKRQASSP